MRFRARSKIDLHAGGRGRGAPPAPQEPPTSVCSWLRARVGLSADRTRQKSILQCALKTCAFAIVLLDPVSGAAQTGTPSAASTQDIYSNSVRYARGQSVQPVFEGWSRNPDGSFAL